jgi:hypothetical protein
MLVKFAGEMVGLRAYAAEANLRRGNCSARS